MRADADGLTRAALDGRLPAGAALPTLAAGLVERASDRLPNGVGSLEHLVVPETQNPVALAVQPSRPRLVPDAPPSVLTAVDLDHHPRLDADEVDDEATDWVLAAELEAVQLPLAQLRPEQPLGEGHLAAQSAGGRLGG